MLRPFALEIRATQFETTSDAADMKKAWYLLQKYMYKTFLCSCITLNYFLHNHNKSHNQNYLRNTALYYKFYK